MVTIYGENRMTLPSEVNMGGKNRIRRVVFYGRVSTEHEAQLAALENQMQWYDDQALYHKNWIVQRKYIDEGITGTQAKKRPAFLEMIRDAQQGKFDLIVTREVCRFARNIVDTLVHTRALKSKGVEVYFVEDNIWTMDGDGELRLALMATLAQEESRKTSERVRAGQKISRDKGVLYGNGNILGYDRVNGTYVVNEEQAETVRIIYDLYASGMGYKKIAAELVRLQRRDSYGLVRWEMVKISRILRNATYKGYQGYFKSQRNNFLDQKVVLNRDTSKHLYIKGDFEPIISEELWDKCRAIRESRYTKVKDKLDNKIVGYNPSTDVWVHKLKCRCGSSMRKNKWRKNKSGEIVYGYKCYNQLNNGSKTVRVAAGVSTEGYCDLSEVGDWKLELMSKKIFMNLWGNCENVVEEAYSIYSQVFSSGKSACVEENAVVRNQIERHKKRLENLTAMRIDGEITKEEYQTYKEKTQAEIDALEQELYNEQGSAYCECEKMSREELTEILSQKLDFSKHHLDRSFLEKMVARIVPMSSTEYRWDINFLPKAKGDWDSYRCICSFQILYEDGLAYKKACGGILRKNQWKDLTVHVYI